MFFRFIRTSNLLNLTNRSSTQEKIVKQGNLRQKRNLFSEKPIRQLQLGVIYQDNEEGRKKKQIFEVGFFEQYMK